MRPIELIRKLQDLPANADLAIYNKDGKIVFMKYIEFTVLKKSEIPSLEQEAVAVLAHL